VLTSLNVLTTSSPQFCKEIAQVPRLHGPTSNLISGWDSLVAVLTSTLTFPTPDTSVTTTDVSPSPNYKLRIYRPPNATGKEKLALYIHGGGGVLGSIDQEDAIARIIAKSNDLVVVSVGYRLAPAHKWPAAHEDCAEAAKYALSHASELGADPEAGILIAGSSAGGGMAFSTALRLIDDGLGDKVKGVVSMAPVTVHPDAIPEELRERYTSYEEHAEHTVNTKDAMEAFFGE
jgi:versiconal hemiacetal acetate esterase